MQLDGLIYRAPKEIKVLIGAFIIVLSVGFYTGLLFVKETSSANPNGIEEQYLGNENQEHIQVMKFKKSDQEMEEAIESYVKKKFKSWESSSKKNKGTSSQHASSGSLYFVGFVGGLIYWLQAANDFGAVITAFLKAMTWPAYIVYKLLENFYGIV